MTVAEALGWGAALVSSAIAVALIASAVSSIARARRGDRLMQIALSEFDLERLAFETPGKFVDFRRVRLLTFQGTLRGSPLVRELDLPGVDREAFEMLKRWRKLLGMVPVDALRRSPHRREVMEFVASFDAGVVDAQRLIESTGSRPSE